MKKFLIPIIAIAAICSCSEDSSVSNIKSDGIMAIPNTPNSWTYVSLEKSKVVGSCALSDTAAQRAWSLRTDWDVAICNGMIRTNSGTSGRGQGGITHTTTPFEQIEDPAAPTYETDRDTVVHM